MTKCKVTKPHKSKFPNPLKFNKGDTVSVNTDRDDEPGWLWCIDVNGIEGWVPEVYVERNGASGSLNRDYDATEMNITVGEELQILDEESSWLLCRKPNGETGWVPGDNVSAE